jgi:hypothetical protein
VGEVRRVDRRQAEALDPKAEVTVRCRTCGTYVVAGAGSCGRGDCPYGRG